jgi:hypothetical protein
MSTLSTSRVPANTAEDINEKIRRNMEENVAYYALAGREAIERRVQELDREWDIERVLEANAAGVSLLGFTFGATRSRLWYLLPALVSGFLLQHAIQGWCPPLELFRRLGFRTRAEIDQERYALKVLRGDFGDLPQLKDQDNRSTIERALEAVRR